MRPKRKRKIERLSATIEKLLTARGLGGRLREYRVFGIWDHAVGSIIARHAQPGVIRGKKLTVIVDSSAWMQQLSLLRPDIIAKLNRTLGTDAIESITLRLGEVVRDAGRDEERPAAPEPLGSGDKDRVDAFVRGIADQEVRESLRHLIEKDLMHRRRTT